ncbi:UNVERIFIED_CONTAM: hypothetical protein PYX00_001760 [Menopon gallinae]|uniref:RNA-directed DNA polymerase n=1 Tax=Menopon gallinae TaxID=328185 RepID=A0AAW2IEN9_9NEOP
MEELASRGNIDRESLFSYVIDGLQGDMSSKIVLFGAKTMIEFKEKLRIYKEIRTKMHTRHGVTGERNKREGDHRPKESKIKCFNCGEENHFSKNCPSKNLGVKCFKCKQYGHRANECKGKASNVKVVKSNRKRLEDENYRRDVNIDGKIVKAYIDAGSEVTTIRTSIIEEWGMAYLPSSVTMRGFGQGLSQAKGERTLLLDIEGVQIEGKVLLVPDEAQEDEMIIGRNILSQPGIRVTIEEQKLLIERKQPTESGEKTVQIKKININHEIDDRDKEKVRELVEEYDMLFPTDVNMIGETKHIKMKIELTNQEPINQKPYRVPYAEREKVNEIVNELLEAKIIRESTSPYGSPSLLVAKKDGSKRLCVDYRRLNAITKKERIPMPVIDELLDQLAGRYEIDGNGVRPGKRKTEAVQNFETPGNVHEVRQFLGLSGFFRRFIERYSIIAEPLTSLTRRDVHWTWGTKQEEAFRRIKEILSSRPVLTLYNPKGEFQVHTDASSIGFAGIIFQRVAEEPWKPLAYFSRRTTDTERNYHSYELEILAVVETLERFRIYLISRPFTVVTDCNSMKTLMTKGKLVPRIARWALRLQEFDFEISHRSGDRMRHVDALSRKPVEEAQELIEDSFKIMDISINDSDWLLAMQMQDEKLKTIHEALKTRKTLGKEDFVLKHGRVYRKEGETLKWVVPRTLAWRVIRASHDDMGHFGIEKTLTHLKRQFWFPKMRKKVTNYIKGCVKCAYHKEMKGKPEGELYPIPRVPVPFHTVHMDHLGPLVTSPNRERYVLLYQDNFTKYTILKAVTTTKTKPTIECLQEIFSYFGTPTRLITDRGSAFTSRDFEKFCEDHQIQHVKNATGTPKANGQAERQNQTLLSALKTMCEKPNAKDWSRQLKQIQFALNDLPNATTRKTPHELLFAYNPRSSLKNQLILALHEPCWDGKDMESERQIALSNIVQKQQQDKTRYDSRHKKPTRYKEGDCVLVKKEYPATGESRKLLPKYKGPYMIRRCLPHDRYVLVSLPGEDGKARRRHFIFATDRLKPWCKLDEDTEESESEVAESDQEEDKNFADGAEDGTDCSVAECHAE